MPATDVHAHAFCKALQQFEQDGNLEPLARFFANNAQISSIALRQPLEGRAGVQTFWRDYLSVFQNVASTFRHVHGVADLAVLEWTSEGVLVTGEMINYQGVSILEFTGERISRFRTYYDSAAFLPDGAKLLGRSIQT